MKVLVRAPFGQRELEKLRGMYDEVTYDPWSKTGEWFEDGKTLELLQREKPDIFITELDRVQEKALTGCQGLKALGVCRANPSNVDVARCSQAGIPILCTPARNAQAVAECGVGMLLCFMRHIHKASRWEMEGEWGKGKTPYHLFKGDEIHGKKAGFVGFGATGQATAKILKAFGAKTIYYDPFVEGMDDYRKVSLEEIFETCDIVSIHLPVNNATKGMIGKDLLGMMKEEAIFLNTSRSAVVDMDQLHEIASRHKIKGAILDVVEHEPPTADDLERWNLDNVLLTPHICGASFQVVDHHSRIMVDRLMQWEAKKELEKIVFNKEVLG